MFFHPVRRIGNQLLLLVWKFAKKAVETNFWPLVEIENGKMEN